MICGFLSLCQYAHTLTKSDPGPVRRQSPEDCNLEHHRVPTPDGPRPAAAALLFWYGKMGKNERGKETAHVAFFRVPGETTRLWLQSTTVNHTNPSSDRLYNSIKS
ncbi:hypothetical protein E2C01_074664 [Portunus trituberculatus]|uniref:Uncharacterized protein n=1 Tax=Portunus trituberculatus TaxID=210409 RepID=A0A5B7IEV6_PORTR|nr:hypothetical protein [Portunus trituberculatus]